MGNICKKKEYSYTDFYWAKIVNYYVNHKMKKMSYPGNLEYFLKTAKDAEYHLLINCEDYFKILIKEVKEVNRTVELKSLVSYYCCGDSKVKSEIFKEIDEILLQENYQEIKKDIIEKLPSYKEDTKKLKID